MNTLDTMFAMRQLHLKVPVVIRIPELGVAVEVVAVRQDEAVNYWAADGSICRGPAVVLEAVPARAPAPDTVPDS